MQRLMRFLLVMSLLAITLVIPATHAASSTLRTLPLTDPILNRVRFEELIDVPVDGTDHPKVERQFRNLGIRFNQPVAVDYESGEAGVQGFARSGVNAIQHCFGQENGGCTTPLIVTFDQPQSRVKIFVGVLRGLETTANVKMTAYDAKNGGKEITSALQPLIPVNGDQLPVNTPLQVASDLGNAISRVEVGFSPPADASWLVFDDLEFEASAEPVSDDPLPEPVCSEGARQPTVFLQRAETVGSPQVNEVSLEGSITTTDPILTATLTTTGPGGEKSMALSPDRFNQANGDFTLPVEEILLPARNKLTLSVESCGGIGTDSLQLTYTPVETSSYYVAGVEVTQVVQNTDNTVPLIAGKRTFVRVYLQVPEGTPALTGVSGVLPICHAPLSEPSRCATTDSAFTPLPSDEGNVIDDVEYVTDKRNYLGESLDFDVPPSFWGAGQLWLDLGNLALSPDFDCTNCVAITPNNAGLMSVDLQDAPPLLIEVGDATYTVDGVVQRPSDLDWARLKSWLLRAYPTSDVQFLNQVGDVSGEAIPLPCQTINQLMFSNWVASSNLNTLDALDETPIRFLALISHPDPDALVVEDPEYEGCASRENEVVTAEGTPVAAMRFATGVAGSGLVYEWDHDGSFADFNGAHELGHIYGRSHVGPCGTTGKVDDGYLPKDGRISDNEWDFGFDVGDASMTSDPPPPAEIATASYHPEKTMDIMSYCNNRWMSAYTYIGLHKNLPVAATVTPGPNVVEREVPSPDDAGSSSDDVFAVEAALPDQVLLAATPTAGEAGEAPGPAVLAVIGTIYLPDNAPPTAEILPFSRLPGVAVTPRDTNGSFRIVLENGSGTPVADYPFTPARYTDTPPGGTPTAQMSEVVPWDDDTAVVKIYGPDPGAGASTPQGTPTSTPGPLATQVVSTNVPQVTVTAPNGGETLTSSSVVTWDGKDGDGDVLTYTLLYSTDRGATWRSIAGGLKNQQYTLDLDRLPGSDDAIFRVIATDGVNTGQDDSDRSFEVPNNPPEVGIVSPADGSHFGSSRSIVLAGRASDVEQGDLDDAALQWSSNIDGPIGPGLSTSVTDLSPGLHTLTLTATDAEGISTETSIRVEIGDDDAPVETWDPSKDISSFPDGLFFYGGNERRGEAYTTDGAGAIQPLNTYFTFLHEWTAIVPGHFSGDDALTDLFLYSADTGLGEFYTSDGKGGLTLLSSSKDIPNPATGWDMVVPGDFGGDDIWTDLFFYDQETDKGAFYTSDGDGQLKLLDITPAFDETWTSIVPGNFGGNDRTDLLFYNADTGLSQFHTSDGRGCLILLLEDDAWTKGWDQIVPGNFGGNGDWTDLFFSRTDDGKGESSREYKVYSTDGQGNIVEIGQPGQLEPHWTTMIGGDFSGDDMLTDLLLYDAVSGQRVFLTTDGAGGLIEVSPPATGSSGWDLIVPGRYTGVSG